MTPAPINESMAFGDHLEELRRRLFFALLGPIPIFIVCLIFGGPILEFLMGPVESQLRAVGLPTRLLATSPTEPFGAYLKVALVVGLLVAGPWVVYQTWLFVAPGLYAAEKRFAYFLIPMSAVLTIAGTIFLFTILLPVSLRFLIQFGSTVVQIEPATAALPPGAPPLPHLTLLPGDPPAPAAGQYWFNTKLQELRVALPQDHDKVRILGAPFTGGGAIAQQYRISEYINLVFVLGLVFAVTFQLPLVMLLLGWTGLITPATLAPHRRYVIFGCAVAGAVLTPSDPASMILLAIPLYALFEFGLLLMRFLPAKRIAQGAESRPSAKPQGAAPTDADDDEEDH